jgi:hypothetical protein
LQGLLLVGLAAACTVFWLNGELIPPYKRRQGRSGFAAPSVVGGLRHKGSDCPSRAQAHAGCAR